jgi:hypothetical protein
VRRSQGAYPSVSLDRTRPFAALLGSILATALVLILAIPHSATALGVPPQTPLGSSPLEGYVAGIARAWEPYTTPDGRIEDPLDPADTGDNYGVILLADVMLKVARRTDDRALEAAATRIVTSALTLPVPNDPFNLLAISAAIHDGESGEFPAQAWQQVSGPLMARAGQIGPPTEATCLTEPTCYDNWRLVWSAGASLLLSDHLLGVPGSLVANPLPAAAQIRANLAMAVRHAGAPLSVVPATGLIARELSDPGAEPPSYELFSAFMLELIGEVNPQVVGPTANRLRRQADRYALDMMAPDGQLSLSGRSLDQSWVQAAGAALGVRRASLELQQAPMWRAYADRAISYLLSAYPIRADGLLPIVPGLGLEWNPLIMDGYAAFNQYEGLTLWLLSDALAQWPRLEASRVPLPPDSRRSLADDLGSSGLVWGRSGGVWWEVSGHTTGTDPRSAQGLVAVKLARAGAWRALLALRPLHGPPTSVWTLGLPHGREATPTFTRVRGGGARAVLSGSYLSARGRVLARARWVVSPTATGLRLSMSIPAKAALRTTVWLASSSRHVSAPGARVTREQCTVTASGRACPVTIYWHHRRAALLEVGE